MDLSQAMRIDGPRQLRSVIALSMGIETGAFELLTGNLESSDYVECKVLNRSTGKNGGFTVRLTTVAGARGSH